MYGILFIGQSDGSIKLMQCANDSTISQQIIAKKSRPITCRSKQNSPLYDGQSLAAKSCAIQNMIKDERNLKQIEIDSTELSSLNYNHKHIPLNVKDFPTNLNSSIFANCINEQILLHGLSLKQHYTKSIVCALHIGYLFAQCGQQMRCYNIENGIETNMNNGKLSTDIALACDSNNKEYLVSIYFFLSFNVNWI